MHSREGAAAVWVPGHEMPVKLPCKYVYAHRSALLSVVKRLRTYNWSNTKNTWLLEVGKWLSEYEHLLLEHENLSSNLQNSSKEPSMTEHAYHLSAV